MFSDTKMTLIIDQEAVREAYRVHAVSNVGFICGPTESDDGLTKIDKLHALYHLWQTGK